MKESARERELKTWHSVLCENCYLTMKISPEWLSEGDAAYSTHCPYCKAMVIVIVDGGKLWGWAMTEKTYRTMYQ